MGNKESSNYHGGKSRHTSGEYSSGGSGRASATPPPSGYRPRNFSESESNQPLTVVPGHHVASTTSPSGQHLMAPGGGGGKVFMQPVADAEVEFDPARFGQNQKGSGLEPMMRFRTTTISEGTRIDNKKLPSVFKWDGRHAKEVYLVGSFNHWKAKIPLRKSQETFYTIVDLPEGDHEYKFLVDGQWKHDSHMPSKSNQYGSFNNILSVKKTDFEVLEALALDSFKSDTTTTTPAAAAAAGLSTCLFIF